MNDSERSLLMADTLTGAYETFCNELDDLVTRHREALPDERVETGGAFLMAFHTARERLNATTALAALDYEDRAQERVG